ncbi:hypothetical protein K449DRAFT_135936 [Hypoxylon sp. EC38]|nr:hypothetical protein K449DRAFT_135936 [Hypoxylon sp. EC38]
MTRGSTTQRPSLLYRMGAIRETCVAFSYFILFYLGDRVFVEKPADYMQSLVSTQARSIALTRPILRFCCHAITIAPNATYAGLSP